LYLHLLSLDQVLIAGVRQLAEGGAVEPLGSYRCSPELVVYLRLLATLKPVTGCPIGV